MRLPTRRFFVVVLFTVIFGQTVPSAQSGVLIVSNTQDAGNDSLRATIAAAAAGDTIEFNIPATDPGYDASTGVFTITLTGGEIVIAQDLTITNATAAKIAISGNHASRIFNVSAGTVAITNLSFINGKAKGADGIIGGSSKDGMPGMGGAVLNQGTLSLVRCTFRDNAAIGGIGARAVFQSGGVGGDGSGGALANKNALSLVACTLAGNSTQGGMSGIGGNSIPASAPGGKGFGGGIYNADIATLSMTNCTIVGNTTVAGAVQDTPPLSPGAANAHGGGIANLGTLSIVHSTLANNTAVGGASLPSPLGGGMNGGQSFGGGLYCAAGAVASPRDTIFARNSALGGAASGVGSTGVAVGPDAYGTISSQGHNLLGRSDGCLGFTGGDLQGGTTDETSLDPKLGPLGDYGGATQTLSLLPGSPAIDGGNYVESSRDQRYFFRTVYPDIGAFEYQGTQPVLLANISTRLRIGTGDRAMIGGFIITGTVPKTVIVRGIAPSLPLSGVLADPIIEVHGSSSELLAENDNWKDATSRWEIVGSGLPPSNDLESALWGTINPGAYSCVVRGKNDDTGVALFEVYDLDQTVDAKLANVSTRGFVETNDNVMIGGTIIVGSAPRVLFRAIGPNLANFGVPNPLADPVLSLHGSNGELIATNDNWRDDQESEILATGIAPTYNAESAIVRDLVPGSYTAVLQGAHDGIGVALIEVYDLN